MLVLITVLQRERRCESQRDTVVDVWRADPLHADRTANRLCAGWSVIAIYRHALGDQCGHRVDPSDLRHDEVGGFAGNPLVHPDGLHSSALRRDRRPLQSHGPVVRSCQGWVGHWHSHHLCRHGCYDWSGRGRCYRHGNFGPTGDAEKRLQTGIGTRHHMRIGNAGHPYSSIGVDHCLRGHSTDFYRSDAHCRHRSRAHSRESLHLVHRRDRLAAA